MTTTDPDTFDADHPVEDRYTPPACGELDEIAAALTDGRLSGGAPILTLYEQALADWFGTRRAVAVSSGTSALHAALTAAGVKPGDEVMLPATAPLPTAMPILTCGATPVIVDIVPGALALDPDSVSARITRRTKAAITLPLWGYPADEHATAGILAAAGVPIIEDACQAHGTKVRGRYAGTTGLAGCFSTHDRKLLSTGEGGFLLTDDDELADRIDYYTHLGHLKGHVHGTNYKLAAPLAAIGLRRVQQLSSQLRKRQANAATILAALEPGGPVSELGYGPGDAPNYYTLVLTATSPDTARAAAESLAAAGLPPDSRRYGYRPLYHQPLFADYAAECPAAESLAAVTLQLPVHPGLSPASLQWVTDRVASISQGHAGRRQQ